MASAQRRSGTRGRPPPKRWVFTRAGNRGSSTAHNSSEMKMKKRILAYVGAGALAVAMGVPAATTVLAQTPPTGGPGQPFLQGGIPSGGPGPAGPMAFGGAPGGVHAGGLEDLAKAIGITQDQLHSEL